MTVNELIELFNRTEDFDLIGKYLNQRTEKAQPIDMATVLIFCLLSRLAKNRELLKNQIGS